MEREPGGQAHGIGFVDLDGDTAGIIRPSSAPMGKPAFSALRRAVRQLEEALVEGSGIPQTHHKLTSMRALMRSTRTSPHERTSQLALTMIDPA